MNKEERRIKIIEGKKKGKEEGRYQGGNVPFGYRKNSNGILEKDGKNFEILQGIVNRKKLVNEKIKPRELEKTIYEKLGIKISYRTIYRILKR